jgi:hypothetical protein
MSKTQRPPLTPADCIYLGKGLDGLDTLRWESQSRGFVRHHTYGTLAGAQDCSCEWRQNNPTSACKHMLAFVDALRHHLGEPPPADPGGAALNAAQVDADGEIEDWRDELPANFGAVAITPAVLERAFGPTGTPPLAAVAVSAWGNLPATLDEAVTDDGDRWIQSRTAAGVRLVCASCGAVRGWPTEVGAIDWLATDGVCGCGGAGPTPPAPGAGRKPLSEHLSALYGDS